VAGGTGWRCSGKLYFIGDQFSRFWCGVNDHALANRNVG
jgi:hypothetical protein